MEKKKKSRTRVWERGRGTPEKIGSSFLQIIIVVYEASDASQYASPDYRRLCYYAGVSVMITMILAHYIVYTR